MKLILKILGVILLLLVISYLLGPRAKFEKVSPTPAELKFEMNELEAYVDKKESAIQNIKPDNHSQFIWADNENKTEYAIVYLHGFSASHGEAQPILTNLSKQYGCNVYLPRLYRHGLNDVDAYSELTPKGLMDSAREAIAIAKNIGEKLIVVSTSTGSTLSTYLAAYDDDIKAMIMTSPNFDLYDQNSRLLLKPWGRQIFKQMMGGDYREWEASEDVKKYWTTKNRIDGHIALRSLLNQTMTDDIFQKIEIPIYVGYFFASEEKKDKIISIDAIKHFENTISTTNEHCHIVPFSSARGHVISSKYMNSNWKEVQTSIFEFCEEVIGMQAVTPIEAELSPTG